MYVNYLNYHYDFTERNEIHACSLKCPVRNYISPLLRSTGKNLRATCIFSNDHNAIKKNHKTFVVTWIFLRFKVQRVVVGVFFFFTNLLFDRSINYCTVREYSRVIALGGSLHVRRE